MTDIRIPERGPAGDVGPRPIFVLGINRSGTTWMANLLSNHPQIVSVQSEDHFGIHESIFFSHFAQAYGDISNNENFEKFYEGFTTSDYYILTGLEPEWLRERRPRGYPEAFRAVMEEMVRRHGGALAWLEKSPHHSLIADQLARDFPDARFLCITRELNSHVRSRLYADGKVPPPYPARLLLLARLAVANAFYERWLTRFSERCERATRTQYEDLVGDLEGELTRIMGFLELPFDSDLQTQRFAPNSSFRSAKDRKKKTLNALDRLFIRAVRVMSAAVPLVLLQRGFTYSRRRRGLDWPDWCWRRRDAGAVIVGK